MLVVPIISEPSCHELCIRIYNDRKKKRKYQRDTTCKGMGVMILKDKSVLLGLENYGRNQGLYHICTGRINVNKDHGCYLRTAQRELLEEFKISLNLRDIEKHSSLVYNLGIAVLVIDERYLTVNINKINNTIKQHQTKYTNGDLTEISNVKWYSVGDRCTNVTFFTKELFKKLKI